MFTPINLGGATSYLLSPGQWDMRVGILVACLIVIPISWYLN